MPDTVVLVHSLYAEATLPDATPVNPPLVYDGVVVSEIPVPSGQFAITDCYFGLGFVYWTIEVDFGLGGGFVPLATFGFTLITPPITEKKNFKSPIVVQGGPGVKIRLKVAAAVAPPSPIDVNATIRCYSKGMGALGTISYSSRSSTVITLTAPATIGAAEEVLGMSENAGPGTLALPVPAGSFLQIDDFDVAAGGLPGTFKLQQTNDGITWFTIGALQVPGIGMGVSIMASPVTSWRINGDDGPAVAFRVAETTLGGATPVAVVLSGYRVS